MQSLNIWDYSVEFDKSVTANWYEGSEGWGCECDCCQNFLSFVKQKQLPEEITKLLSDFGVLPEKPTYVCNVYRTENLYLCQFNYRVAGRMLNDPHPDDSIQLDWGSFLCGHEIYPYGSPNFPSPSFDLMFFVNLPWVPNR